MSSSIRTYITSKYEDRDDLLTEYRHSLVEPFQQSPDLVDTITDKELTQEVKMALKYIHGTRDEMVSLKLNGPICEEELSALIDEAREVHRALKFRIRRHYQNKEEGLRLRRELELNEIGDKAQTSPIGSLLADSFFRLKTRTSMGMTTLKVQCEKKLKVLDKAMAKIDSDRLLVVLLDEGFE
ncbi:Fc.00g044330.m01.CDS01 [Cosmosporella sp. VM-42]